MFDEALLFLFYRKDYKFLLTMIQKNFEKEQAKVTEIVSTYRASKSGSSSSKDSKTTSISHQQRQQAKAEQKQKLEHHRSFSNYWMHQYRKYCQKVNSALPSHEQAESFILSQISWVFKSDPDNAIDCLKKQHTFLPPFMSNETLQFIKQHGDFKAVV
jgi:predicted metal-dependent phosphotriesterase family hydrolase